MMFIGAYHYISRIMLRVVIIGHKVACICRLSRLLRSVTSRLETKTSERAMSSTNGFRDPCFSDFAASVLLLQLAGAHHNHWSYWKPLSTACFASFTAWTKSQLLFYTGQLPQNRYRCCIHDWIDMKRPYYAQALITTRPSICSFPLQNTCKLNTSYHAAMSTNHQHGQPRSGPWCSCTRIIKSNHTRKEW